MFHLVCDPLNGCNCFGEGLSHAISLAFTVWLIETSLWVSPSTLLNIQNIYFCYESGAKVNCMFMNGYKKWCRKMICNKKIDNVPLYFNIGYFSSSATVWLLLWKFIPLNVKKTISSLSVFIVILYPLFYGKMTVCLFCCFVGFCLIFFVCFANIQHFSHFCLTQPNLLVVIDGDLIYLLLQVFLSKFIQTTGFRIAFSSGIVKELTFRRWYCSSVETF